MADAAPATRAKFIRKTYAHLAGAILAFIGLEYALLQSEAVVTTALRIASSSWLLVLGGFMLIGWIARAFTSSSKSIGQQYFGLGLYVLGWALMFVPIMAYAIYSNGGPVNGGMNVVYQAGITTLLLVGGLTATVFITRKDFSFLGSILMIGSMVAFGMIIAGVLFGFSLGLWFSAAMVFLAAGTLLYSTSNVLHHYGEDQYVAASLELFASVALLFWYILQIFLSRR